MPTSYLNRLKNTQNVFHFYDSSHVIPHPFPPLQIIGLLFIFISEFFDEPCKFDYLLIRDGDFQGKIVGIYCGNDIPKYIESKGTSLWVNMITDGQDDRAGFRASWELKKSLNLGELKFQVALACHWLALYKDLFSILSNIYDGFFCENI